MPIVKIDKKWRIVLPKGLRKSINLKPNQHLRLRGEKNSIVMTSMKQPEKIGKNDPLWNDIFENPAHADPKKIKKLDLEKLEEEMWLS